MGFAPIDHLTVNDTADKLGKTPWEILNLIDAGAIEAITLVDAGSLAKYQQEKSA